MSKLHQPSRRLWPLDTLPPEASLVMTSLTKLSVALRNFALLARRAMESYSSINLGPIDTRMKFQWFPLVFTDMNSSLRASMPSATLLHHALTTVKLYGSSEFGPLSSLSIRCELNACILAAPCPRHGWMKTFPMKLMILLFNHFIGRKVAISHRSTLCSPPPGRALAATGSSLLPDSMYRLFSRRVMGFPVSLGVTPRLIVPMVSLMTAHCEGLILRKSLQNASSVSPWNLPCTFSMLHH